MDAAAASRFCIDFLEQLRALLEGERTTTADDTDPVGVYLGWLFERGREVTADSGGRTATADADMAAHLLGVLVWLCPPFWNGCTSPP